MLAKTADHDLPINTRRYCFWPKEIWRIKCVKRLMNTRLQEVEQKGPKKTERMSSMADRTIED